MNMFVAPNTVQIMPALNQVRSTSDSNQANFLQVVGPNFAQLTLSQTVMVPGSYGDETLNFWQTKEEIEFDLPTMEEAVEDKIEDLVKQIKRLSK